MSKFFSYYPKTLYTLQNDKSIDVITNLTTNFSFLGDILDNSSNYYEYTIGEGDTPENIAHNIYGNSEYHWIILKTNNILDTKKDWPIDYSSLNESINVSYSTSEYADTQNTFVTGLQWAKNHTHSYYKIETKEIINSGIIEINEYRIDGNTYANLTSNITPTFYTLPNNDSLSILITKESKTYYEYEIEENENKRNIKILKTDFIPVIDIEFKKIMENNV
jgi:hypothetical protein